MKTSLRSVASIALLVLATGCDRSSNSREHLNAPTAFAVEYPQAKTVDAVDDYHGTKVADPYRWLEDANTPETKAFVDAENGITRRFIDGPTRERVRARLTELWDYPKIGAPRHEGNRYFFSRNDGLQNQAVLYVRDSLDGPPRVLIDPNTLSTDGTAALSSTAYSYDGEYVAYGVSRSGSDQKDIRIRRVSDGKDLD